MSTENLKGRRVKVNTPKGVRYLSYAPAKCVEGVFICQSSCPYGMEVCKSLRHPEQPDDPELSFLDFCSSLGSVKDDAIMCNDGSEFSSKDFVGGDESLATYCPVEGTIEKDLVDCDLGNAFQNLIKEGHYVKLDKVIDTVCKGVCPMYNPEHSSCNMKNELCLLHDLVKSE